MKPSIQLNGKELQEFLKYYDKLPKRPRTQAELDREVRYWYTQVYERNNHMAAK